MVEEAISFWTEIQRFEDLLAADPRSLSFAPLSELYRKLGLMDDALAVAQKGCDLHPDYPGGFFALGTAYLGKGLRVEARAALERVVRLNPENLRAQKLLGQLYVEAGERALAEEALGQVLERNPDDTESSLLLRSVVCAGYGAQLDEESLEEAELVEEGSELDEEAPEPEAESAESGFPDVPGKLPSQVDPERSSPRECAEISEFLDFFEVYDPPELSDVAEFPSPAAGRPVPAGARDLPAPAPHGTRDPLRTATLAELYLSQGFPDKAIAIYQELLAADPGQHPYRLRLMELTAVLERQKSGGADRAAVLPPPAQLHRQAADAGAAYPAALSLWLENIRRRRDGI